MEQNFKSITKQLAIAAFILISVTVLSFGIRYVRFSAHLASTIENSAVADTGESTPVRPLDPENQPKLRQSLGADAEPYYYPEESHTVDAEPDLQYANASDSDKEASYDDHSEAHTSSGKAGKAFSKVKSFKGDYAKAKGSKGLKKISLGNNDNIYITEEGELWYVSKQPDGSTAKMQVQIDEGTGEFTAVGNGYYAKSEGSQGLQRISVGENEDLYITGEDQVWYVSEQPDGSTAKMQLQTENIDGEVTIVGSGEMNVYPADGDKSDED